jgi:D-tyrosyl-tRNA(Tyr) deacylase
MRVVIQRVGAARVEVDSELVGQIGAGVAVLVGITHGDTPIHAEWAARRVSELRIFPDADGKMNRSLLDIDGGALVVSQFTLYADTSQGRRPSYLAAAPPAIAAPLVKAVADGLRTRGVDVATGRFGAHMDLHIHADGPVTIVLDTDDVPSLARNEAGRL